MAVFGTPRLGDKVIECSRVGYRYAAEGEAVLSEVDLVLGPRERLGLVGDNGSGKSTLLDLLDGRRQPTSGLIDVGPTVVTGYYDQQGVELDPDARVGQLVAGPTRAPGAPEDVALMERFWFAGALQFARTRTLSGGERRRLQLLLVLAGRPNVLLLDEPTNDLDLDTLRLLEDFLEDWPGALVVVSHDRTFLQRTTERLVALEGTTTSPVPGGLDAWLARAEVAAVTPSAPTGLPRASAVGRAAARPASSRARRSPSTISRQLREAEKTMTRLGRRRDELSDELGAATDHLELARLGRQLAEAQAELTEAENRWLILGEEADGGP
jgi:ATP-binding cassette subfamily F protein uup